MSDFDQTARAVINLELGGLEGGRIRSYQSLREEGAARATLRTKRQDLIEALDIRFPGGIPGEVRQLVEEQDSLPLLNTWFRAALRAVTVDDFLLELRR